MEELDEACNRLMKSLIDRLDTVGRSSGQEPFRDFLGRWEKRLELEKEKYKSRRLELQSLADALDGDSDVEDTSR